MKGQIDFKEKILYIETLRQERKHDLYVIAGQLQESNVDPIDSWTFFLWLQKNNIPSCYILKENDSFYQNKVKGSSQKDVIVLQSYNRGYELLAYTDIWSRACAFVVEWDLGGTEIDRWLRGLYDCRYVFLQHGITGNYITNLLLYPCHNIYNDVNVSSETERNLIEQGDKEHLCFIGGLPRYELIEDKSPKGQDSIKTVLVMLTWRNKFATETEALYSSAYWQGQISLLKKENIDKLQRHNINIVFALHHSLIKKKDVVNLPDYIKTIQQADIAYWVRHANALVTDFSSLSFDFLFQHKPVIYWIPDKDAQVYEPNSIDRNKLDSVLRRRHLFFNCLSTEDEIIEKLIEYANNDFTLEKCNADIADTWFVNRKDISRHIYEQIEQRLSLERFFTAPLKERLSQYKQEGEEYSRQIACCREELTLKENIIAEKNTIIGSSQQQINDLTMQIYNLRDYSGRKIKHLRKVRGYLIWCIGILLLALILIIYSVTVYES